MYFIYDLSQVGEVAHNTPCGCSEEPLSSFAVFPCVPVAILRGCWKRSGAVPGEAGPETMEVGKDVEQGNKGVDDQAKERIE